MQFYVQDREVLHMNHSQKWNRMVQYYTKCSDWCNQTNHLGEWGTLIAYKTYPLLHNLHKNKLEWETYWVVSWIPCSPAVMHQAPLHSVRFVFYEFQRELQLMERDKALMELERRWRVGEQWPQTSKTAWLFSLQLSTPTGVPGPTTVSGNADAPPANFIDLHSPLSMSGKNISGMMATMNIIAWIIVITISFLKVKITYIILYAEV